MPQPTTSTSRTEFFYRATPKAIRTAWVVFSSAAVWVIIIVLGWPNQHWGVVLLGTVCILGSLSFAILPLLHYVRVTSAGVVYKPVYEQERFVPHESLSIIKVYGHRLGVSLSPSNPVTASQKQFSQSFQPLTSPDTQPPHNRPVH